MGDVVICPVSTCITGLCSLNFPYVKLDDTSFYVSEENNVAIQ